ncbi:phage minor capsid protein [Streptomyces sp. NPDC058268]|uniref:phage minor capsid protein n=1 Tax=Streptomyces sp. NPDC058268 TaxID=3346413 RepID=UPI0036E68C96
MSDEARALIDDVTPNAQAVGGLAQESVDVVASTHRSIPRAAIDGFRAIVVEVTATPLRGTGSRRQATQDAMRRFADAGIRAFTHLAGRRWQLTSYAETHERGARGDRGALTDPVRGRYKPGRRVRNTPRVPVISFLGGARAGHRPAMPRPAPSASSPPPPQISWSGSMPSSTTTSPTTRDLPRSPKQTDYQ